MLINEHFFIDCLNLGNWKISVVAQIDNLSIWNSVDHAEQKSCQKIYVPCLDEVKYTQGTLSNPVKYLHYIAQNNKGFEIISLHRRHQGELCHAWGQSQLPLTGALPGCGTAWPCPPSSPTGNLTAPSAAWVWMLPFNQAWLPCSWSLCPTQNSRVLARRRPQANLVMEEQSRVFKINKPNHRQLGSVMVSVFHTEITG